MTRTTTSTAGTIATAATLAIASATALSGCLPTNPNSDANTAATPGAVAQPSPHAVATAREALAGLTVEPETAARGYDRDAWGAWTTRDGCNTRERVLLAQGQGVELGKGCTPVCPTMATTGVPCWVSPYDGLRTGDRDDLQIDHVVPVKEAMRSGAAHWTRAQRRAFYNDARNLVAASVHANESKGDDDPGRWRPSLRADWCGYAVTWTATKTRYRLTVDRREHTALVAMLRTCSVGGAR